MKLGEKFMISLNTDYSELYQQIKNIENHFLDCNSLNSKAIYYGIYQNLVNFYYLATLQDPCDKRVDRNKSVLYSGIERLNSLSKKRVDQFILNQDSHRSYISSLFFDFSDRLDEFESSDYYNCIFDQGMPIISSDEGFDILYAFFDECCPNLSDLFRYFLEEDRFFMLPQSEFFSNRSGCSLYNPIENISNVFLLPNVNSLELLSLLVHELSHVEDVSLYTLKASPVNTSLYQMQSPFCEVPAFYNQFRFYDFLLKNQIFEDAVLIDFVNNLEMNFEFMDDLLLFSLYPPKKLKKQSAYLSKKEVLTTILKENREHYPFELEDSLIIDEYISLDDSISYSYGPLFALAMLDDPKLYNEFSMIRGNYFDSDMLTSIGLGQDDVKQKVLKKCNDFFDR